jgi:hypothetical protein
MAYDIGTKPSFNYWQSNLSTDNQIAAWVTASEQVDLLSISCYVAGSSGQTATIELLVWDTIGPNIVARSGQFGSAAGSGASGGQRWETRAPQGTPVLAAGNYWVGWWRVNTAWGEFSYQSGTDNFSDITSAGGPAAPGGGVKPGAIGRYLTVQTHTVVVPPKLEGYVRRSGAWTATYDQSNYDRVRRSGAWTGSVMPRVRRSGVWKPVTP